MRTTLAIAVLATSLTVGATSSPTASPEPAASEAPGIVLTAASTNQRVRKERRIIALVNVRRERNDCRPVRERRTLRRAARGHSREMAAHHTLSHQLPGEAALGTRVASAGYTNWRLVGENVAVGYRKPARLVRAWMRSPGHRRNILDCRFRHIGVGLVRRDGAHWWTQDFGRR